MINSHTNRIEWGTDIVEIPPLRTSENGWYYDFDGNTVGRGNEGREAARRVINERRMHELAKRDFRVPDAVTPKHSVGYHHNCLLAYVEDPGFGQIGVAYNPSNSVMYLDVHPILREIHTRKAYSGSQGHLNVEISSKATPPEIAPKLWGYARMSFPLLKLVDTPEVELQYQSVRENLAQEDGSFTRVANEATYLRTLDQDSLEALASEQIKSLVELFRVLGHHNVRTHTNYVPSLDNDFRTHQIVTGIEVKVTDPTHEEDHTVTIASGGRVNISCGYRESEEKYLQYKKRELTGWMQGELGSPEFEEITFD